ncbi:MAG TPA: DNA-processing protein DprA [Solirubrobacterales bacterium]|nr:DNA-processing protein DprA [Solirubrobacterales bacterium]
MRSLEETAALVALLRTGRRFWHEVAELVEEEGSALHVLDRELASHEEGTLFPDESAPERPNLDSISEEIQAWLAEGIKIVTVLDETYPVNLRTIHDLPPLLFFYGDLRPEDEQSIAIVGTRHPTDAGRELAAEVATDLTKRGYVIVSGLAQGIDAAVHEATVRADGRTVAVIGTGLHRSYPAQNKDLQSRLARESAVLSQFWPDQPPTKRTFPMRNAVMSGFALATVVIEAKGKSGAKMQARLALEHGRPVFLPDSLVREHDWAQEYARRPGTTVVSTAEEIAEHLDRRYNLVGLTA